jgi:hypothetical protein
MVDERFGIVCEIEPATRPDLMRVRHQIGVLSRVASSFLIPDNHIGRATVSSVAVAHEVERMGGKRGVACLCIGGGEAVAACVGICHGGVSPLVALQGWRQVAFRPWVPHRAQGIFLEWRLRAGALGGMCL